MMGNGVLVLLNLPMSSKMPREHGVITCPSKLFIDTLFRNGGDVGHVRYRLQPGMAQRTGDTTT